MVEKNNFEKALTSIAHRGPDSSNIFQTNSIMLGHRRLSIIDLSEEADQPMRLDNRYTIVFNGEIYNFKDVKKELAGFGIIFRTNSDTEVILQAYRKWGEDCFRKFNGMWALAIWDEEKKELILSRDRLGKKPLFYGFKGENFFFASEMKALYYFLDKVEIDNAHVSEAIDNVFSYEATERCLIKGIKRFPAASFGVLKHAHLNIHTIWDPLANSTSFPKSYNEQKDCFRELFLDACKIRMQSDVPIGTALSGGLDSSSVICSMSHLSKQKDFTFQKNWQHAFVASFPGTSLDETDYARKVTGYLQVKADFISIDPISELNDIYKQAYLFEEIYYAPTIPFVQLYRSIRNKGVKVSIDGHGADELFGGYPFDMNYALIDAMPNPGKLKNVFDAIENTSGEKIKDKKQYLKFALKNKFPALSVFTSNKEFFKKREGLDFFNSQLFNSSFLTILPTLLRNYDRYSMMNGVEIRMPFLDYRIVEFAFNIPYHSKIKKGYGKAIIRDALDGIVPDEILHRKKKIGFNSPMNIWLTGPIKEWLLDTINGADFANSSLINAKTVRKNIFETLENKELSYHAAERSFAQIMPYIWEKSLKLHNE